MQKFHGTTIIAVRRDGRLAMGGDGQVTFGNTIMKSRARKIRRIYDGKILVGFAGATADAFNHAARQVSRALEQERRAGLRDADPATRQAHEAFWERLMED